MSGSDRILGAIDRGLARLRRDTEALDQQFRSSGDELAEIAQAELTVFARLARLRLHAIASGNPPPDLDDTDRQVAAILTIRAAAESSASARLAAAEEAIATAASERARRQSAVAAAAQAADAATARAATLLDESGHYRESLAAAQEAQAIAEHAEAKAAAAEQDRIDKSKAYEADPVFAYLWRLGFGTENYRGSAIGRWLDTWVARSSAYDSLQRDYRLLQEIPRRLAGHARKMRDKATRGLATARALEAEAAERAGVPAARAALTEAEQQQAELDLAVEQHRAAIRSESEQRARYAAGEDEHTMRCVDLLVDAFRRAGMPALRKRAARTGHDEDEQLLHELERLEQQRSGLQQKLIELRRLHQAQRERALGLEDIRRRLDSAGAGNADPSAAAKSADADAYVDADAVRIESQIDRFVAGAIGTDALWAAVDRGRRPGDRRAGR